MNSSRVTIVAITRNRAKLLQDTIERWNSLPGEPPIVVVDNASDDSTPDVLARWQHRIEALRLDSNYGAAGRNFGVRAAQTPYVAFSDDDSTWAPEALPRAAEMLDAHPRLAVLAARILVGVDGRPDPLCAVMEASPLADSPQLPGRRVLGFVACGAVVRREAFLNAGGFDTRFGVGGEEQLLAIDLTRQGWGLAYCPSVIAHHYPAEAGHRPGRRTREVRNALWTAWLRYRPREALATTGRALRAAASDDEVRAGVIAALRSIRSIVRDRAPIEPPLQRELRLLL